MLPKLNDLHRRDSVMISISHIWHTGLTHSHLLFGEDHAECAHFKCPLTVKHFLLECAAAAVIHSIRN